MPSDLSSKIKAINKEQEKQHKKKTAPAQKVVNDKKVDKDIEKKATEAVKVVSKKKKSEPTMSQLERLLWITLGISAALVLLNLTMFLFGV